MPFSQIFPPSPSPTESIRLFYRKGRGTRDQIANICWIMEKGREFQKNIYFCFIDYAKAFDYVDHSKLWEILKEMGIPDHLTCLLRNLYAGQEARVRTGYGTTDWFQIGKGVRQGCILSPCLFNLYVEYIMWRRQWHPTPVFLPGESQGQGSLVGCVYGVAQSRTRLKQLSSSSSRIHHEKRWAGKSTSWNQDCQEK